MKNVYSAFQRGLAEWTGGAVVQAAVETGATKRMTARRRHGMPQKTKAQSALEIDGCYSE